MNNVFVYCEIEGTKVAEVSQELLTKGRKLADTLGVQLEAVAAGSGITGQVEEQILPYGVDCLHIFDAPGLAPYTSKPHTAVLAALFGVNMPMWWCKGLFPSLMVLGLHYAPFAYILIGGILKNMDANLEEAATILQASR